MSEICFDKETFNVYLFILVCLITFLVYININMPRERFATVDLDSNLTKDQLLIKITDLQEQLFNCKLNNQQCQSDLQNIKSAPSQNSSIQNRFLDKIYNPLAPPENIYPGGSLNSRGYNGYKDYQMIGYLSGASGQYPVYGRYRYPGKTDKLEYYAIDDSRNRIKIPFKTTNYNELYDGDSVSVPEVGGTFIFKKYEDEGLRYDPNI